MNISKPSGKEQRVSKQAARALGCAALVMVAAACASEAASDSGEATASASSASTVEAEVSTTVVTADLALAQAALLAADDLGGGWRLIDPKGNWPNSAELARTAPACASFAELVFEGGADHGTGATLTLQREESLLFNYVVVFESEEEASAMMSAVASPEFDDCWAEFMGVAALTVPMGITEARYVPVTPPTMTFVADSFETKALTGTLTVDGAEAGDSCICVYAQVGRSVVLVHSAEAHLDLEERVAATQTAIDKLRDVTE